MTFAKRARGVIEGELPTLPGIYRLGEAQGNIPNRSVQQPRIDPSPVNLSGPFPNLPVLSASHPRGSPWARPGPVHQDQTALRGSTCNAHLWLARARRFAPAPETLASPRRFSSPPPATAFSQARRRDLSPLPSRSPSRPSPF